MTITTYTTYGSVRTVLGLTAKELSNSQLQEEVTDLMLLDDLNQVGADIITDYASEYANNPAEGTDAKRFINAVRVFAAHAVAFRLLPSISALVPTYITDSKAGLKKDLTKLNEDVTAAYMTARRRLEELYATYAGTPAATVVTMPYMTVSAPAYDPVTNE